MTAVFAKNLQMLHHCCSLLYSARTKNLHQTNC